MSFGSKQLYSLAGSNQVPVPRFSPGTDYFSFGSSSWT